MALRARIAGARIARGHRSEFSTNALVRGLSGRNERRCGQVWLTYQASAARARAKRWTRPLRASVGRRQTSNHTRTMATLSAWAASA